MKNKCRSGKDARRPASAHDRPLTCRSIASGSLREGDIAGDLFDLSKGQQGRSSTSQITLFKSVGHAIEDLSAAALVYRGLLGKS